MEEIAKILGRFITRDLIFVVSGLLVLAGFPEADSLTSSQWHESQLLVLPFLGLAYVTGFTVQSIGHLIGLTRVRCTFAPHRFVRWLYLRWEGADLWPIPLKATVNAEPDVRCMCIPCRLQRRLCARRNGADVSSVVVKNAGASQETVKLPIFLENSSPHEVEKEYLRKADKSALEEYERLIFLKQVCASCGPAVILFVILRSGLGSHYFEFAKPISTFAFLCCLSVGVTLCAMSHIMAAIQAVRLFRFKFPDQLGD